MGESEDKMQSNFLVRLVDLTLLLLLSLLAIVKISDQDVVIPVSHDLEDQGGVPFPVKASVDFSGAIWVEGVGESTAEELAGISSESGRPVELRIDAEADALRLLEIHQVLESFNQPAVFLVEYLNSP